MNIAHGMRALPAELPDDPSPEQVDAWLELAQLVADEGFERRAREMVLAGGTAREMPAGVDFPHGHRAAGRRRRGYGTDPGSAACREVLDQVVPPGTPGADRERLLAQLETFTDERVERYWQLIGTLNGRPPFTPMARPPSGGSSPPSARTADLSAATTATAAITVNDIVNSSSDGESPSCGGCAVRPAEVPRTGCGS